MNPDQTQIFIEKEEVSILIDDSSKIEEINSLKIKIEKLEGEKLAINNELEHLQNEEVPKLKKQLENLQKNEIPKLLAQIESLNKESDEKAKEFSNLKVSLENSQIENLEKMKEIENLKSTLKKKI